MEDVLVLEDTEVNARERLLSLFDLSDEVKENILRVNDEYGPFGDWYLRGASFREINTLEEFKRQFEAGEVENFVYFRPGDLVFNSLHYGNHQTFMGGLYILYRLSTGWIPTEADMKCTDGTMKYMDNWGLCSSGEQDWNNYGNQDDYLKSALGIYQSGCGRTFYRHKNFEMNAREYNTFQSLAKVGGTHSNGWDIATH
jgi:hypothetical protein